MTFLIGCLVKYIICQTNKFVKSQKPPLAATRNGFHIDFSCRMQSEKIYSIPNKVYHFWNVLARGVFFIPQKRINTQEMIE